jgi:hypothetical protein
MKPDTCITTTQLMTLITVLEQRCASCCLLLLQVTSIYALVTERICTGCKGKQQAGPEHKTSVMLRDSRLPPTIVYLLLLLLRQPARVVPVQR